MEAQVRHQSMREEDALCRIHPAFVCFLDDIVYCVRAGITTFAELFLAEALKVVGAVNAFFAATMDGKIFVSCTDEEREYALQGSHLHENPSQCTVDVLWVTQCAACDVVLPGGQVAAFHRPSSIGLAGAH